MSRVLVLIFILFLSYSSQAQNNGGKQYEVDVQTIPDTLLLMNGKYKYGFVDSIGTLHLHYSFNKKIKLSKLYSFTQGEEKLIQYSSRSIDYLTQNQMREIITGKQIGLEKYDNKPIIISSFVLSLASSIFDTYESVSNDDFTSSQLSGDRFFKREPTFAQLLMPITFTFAIVPFKPELKTKHLKDPSYLENELVIEGFQTTVKKKKFYGAMFSGLAGTLTGLISYAIFKP